MKITLRLIAPYRKLLPPETKGNKIELDVKQDTTISDLMARFDIPQDETSVILLNGLTVPLSTKISDGDLVTAFSAIAGG